MVPTTHLLTNGTSIPIPIYLETLPFWKLVFTTIPITSNPCPLARHFYIIFNTGNSLKTKNCSLLIYLEYFLIFVLKIPNIHTVGTIEKKTHQEMQKNNQNTVNDGEPTTCCDPVEERAGENITWVKDEHQTHTNSDKSRKIILEFILIQPITLQAGMIPPFATAGALLYVALLMMSGMQHLSWSDPTELLPALLTIIMVPLTFSIANGIAAGFLSYVILKAIAGKFSDVSAAAWVMAAIFTARFAFV